MKKRKKSIFSKLFKKRGEKLTQEQLDQIEALVQKSKKHFEQEENKNKKYSKKEKTSSELPKHIEKRAKSGKLEKKQKEILEQREKPHKKITETEHLQKHTQKSFVKTGISGFDELIEKGIPKGTSTLVCGGPGSGKTIMGLQMMNYAANNGKKCMYMTFEENEDRLRQHMEDFGWNPDELENKGNLVIKRYDPFDITRSVEALLEKAKGELMIDISPVLFPEGFKPEIVVIDSLTAIASVFYGRQETYRIYIEQLFKLLENLGATSFLITESTQIPVKITESGVEEFLADGVIILYNTKTGNVRESAVEILKMRGTSFQKKIVAMKIESNQGIVVYPEQEVFGST